jgi:hypothetical protein
MDERLDMEIRYAKLRSFEDVLETGTREIFGIVGWSSMLGLDNTQETEQK